jgi:4-amino-4-deoxy-L-arabinose transferase-like glycosyltransferase
MSADRRFVLFLALYCAALLVFTAFALGPRPLHHDMTEAWAWGKEFQLGYAKHPPMSAWLTGLWFTVLPRTDLSFYLLSTLNLAAALTGVWALAGLFLEPRGRLAAVLLLALTPSFNVWAMKFNANAPLLSTWPWTTYFFLRSLETRRADFATLAGLVGAMALLTKYYSVVLFGTLLLVAVLYPTRRQYFRCMAPYITLAIGLLLTLPHIWWMVASGFPTIDYALSKARFDPVEARATTIMTVLVSLCLLGIPASVSIIAFGTRSRALLTRATTAGFDRRNAWLLCLAYGPFAFTVSAYFIANFRITNAFLMPAFFALPMVFLVLSRAPVTNRVVGRIALSAVLVWLPLVLGSPLFGYYALAHAPGMEVESRKDIAEAATEYWHTTFRRPLKIVAGEERLATAATFYSQDAPSYFMLRWPERTPWVSAEHIEKEGLLVICRADNEDCIARGEAAAGQDASRLDYQAATHFLGAAARPQSFVFVLRAPR